jgi:hypothetical protein
MSTTIKGELYVDYNGNLEKTHLVTDAALVRGFEDKVSEILAGNCVRNTSTNLKQSDSLFESGMLIYETDTQQLKITDGKRTYNELPYLRGQTDFEIQVMDENGNYN